jgi:hypothetical protein
MTSWSASSNRAGIRLSSRKPLSKGERSDFGRHCRLSPRQAHELRDFIDVVQIDRMARLEAPVEIVDGTLAMGGQQGIMDAA